MATSKKTSANTNSKVSEKRNKVIPSKLSPIEKELAKLQRQYDAIHEERGKEIKKCFKKIDPLEAEERGISDKIMLLKDKKMQKYARIMFQKEAEFLQKTNGSK